MAVLTQDQADGLADRLAAAEQERVGIARPSGENPALTVEDAYRVQQIGIERRLASGERLVGRKIGLTSRAMQQQLGSTSPTSVRSPMRWWCRTAAPSIRPR